MEKDPATTANAQNYEKSIEHEIHAPFGPSQDSLESELFGQFDNQTQPLRDKDLKACCPCF
jgi:hypothetical protein